MGGQLENEEIIVDDNALARIAQRVNARIDELFGSGQVRSIPQITVGMVRIVLAVAEELENVPPPVNGLPGGK